MPPVLVRSRRLAAAVTLAAAAVTLGGCSLGGDTSLPPFTDPATQTYAASTNIVIANMTRVNQHVYTQDVSVGTGRTIAAGDSISVYYKGSLPGGFVFQSLARPNSPFATILNEETLIKGWVAGLPGMKVGGIRRLAIGPESAYRYGSLRDSTGAILIPSNSVLVFEVEVTASPARQQ